MNFSRELLVFTLAAFVGSAVLANDWVDESKIEKPVVEQVTPETVAPEAPAVVEEAVAEPVVVEETPVAETPVEESTLVPTQTQESSTHEVVKGDTLWDLSAQFYKDPFQWQKIWQANKSDIENPDLIYPLQLFRIPGLSASAQPEVAATETVASEPAAEMAKTETELASLPTPVAEPVKTTVKLTDRPAVHGRENLMAKNATETGHFLSNDEWEGAGRIAGDPDNKLLIGQGDVVFLNVGNSSGLKPRMRGVIYRRGRPMRDPSNGDLLGALAKRVGVVELTQEVQENTATAVVVTSDEPLRVGDYVKLK